VLEKLRVKLTKKIVHARCAERLKRFCNDVLYTAPAVHLRAGLKAGVTGVSRKQKEAAAQAAAVQSAQELWQRTPWAGQLVDTTVDEDNPSTPTTPAVDTTKRKRRTNTPAVDTTKRKRRTKAEMIAAKKGSQM
jgi:hypothetical protein